MLAKSAKESLFKSTHMMAIHQQLKDKRSEDEQQRKHQADLDRRQLEFKVAEDEQKLKAEAEKNE